MLFYLSVKWDTDPTIDLWCIQYVIEILVMYNVPQTAKKNPIPFGRSHRFLTFSIHTLDNVCLIKSKCDIIESHVCFSLLCFPLFRMKIVISMSVFCNGDGFCKWPNYAGIGVSISTLFYSHSTWRKWNEKQKKVKGLRSYGSSWARRSPFLRDPVRPLWVGASVWTGTSASVGSLVHSLQSVLLGFVRLAVWLSLLVSYLSLCPWAVSFPVTPPTRPKQKSLFSAIAMEWNQDRSGKVPSLCKSDTCRTKVMVIPVHGRNKEQLIHLIWVWEAIQYLEICYRALNTNTSLYTHPLPTCSNTHPLHNLEHIY